jgi:hypothetical protein
VTGRSRIYARRVLGIEIAAGALLLALAAPSTALHAAMFCAFIACTGAIVGRKNWRGPAAVRAAGAAGPAGPPIRISDAIVADAAGAVAVLELGETTRVITTAGTALPPLDAWPALSRVDGPQIRRQLLIYTQHPSAHAVLALRACRDGSWHPDAVQAALKRAVRRAARNLEREGISYRRLAGAELADITGISGPAVVASRTHLTIGPTTQVTLRASMPEAGMTQHHLVALTGVDGVETLIDWSRTEAIVRIVGSSEEAVTRAILGLRVIDPVRRLDGEHLHGLRATMPLADRNSGRAPALTVPETLLRIGDDRTGKPMCIRFPARRSAIRLVVVGGPAAARVIEHRARAAGVRVAGAHGVMSVDPDSVHLVMHALEQAGPADADLLRSADIVLCQPLSPPSSTHVASALGLSPASGAWLTRIADGMVAVIADGAVRWAVMTPQVRAVSAARGLADARRT